MSTQHEYEAYRDKLTEPHRLTEWHLLRCVIIALAFIVVMLTIVWSASAQHLEQDGGLLAPPAAVRPGGMDHASQSRPSPGTRPVSKVFAMTTVSYLGLSFADFAISSRCIQAGRCVEIGSYRGVATHPLAFGLVKMGASSALAATAWSLRKQHPKAAWGVLVGLTVAQSAVVVWNSKQGGVR